MNRLTSRVERVEAVITPTADYRVVQLIWDGAEETFEQAKARYEAEHGEPFPDGPDKGVLVIVRKIVDPVRADEGGK